MLILLWLGSKCVQLCALLREGLEYNQKSADQQLAVASKEVEQLHAKSERLANNDQVPDESKTKAATALHDAEEREAALQIQLQAESQSFEGFVIP